MAAKSKKTTQKTQKTKPRQRFAKGRRPFFHDDPAVDKLLAMVMALTGEVAVLKDRLDTHERLAAQGQVASLENIESFEVDDTIEDTREAVRAAMLARVFRILALDDNARAAAEKGYPGLIDKFAKL